MTLSLSNLAAYSAPARRAGHAWRSPPTLRSCASACRATSLRFWQAVHGDRACCCRWRNRAAANPSGLQLDRRRPSSSRHRRVRGARPTRGIDVARSLLADRSPPASSRGCSGSASACSACARIVARAARRRSLATMAAELRDRSASRAASSSPTTSKGPPPSASRRRSCCCRAACCDMPAAVQRAILCHELVHVRRRDWLQHDRRRDLVRRCSGSIPPRADRLAPVAGARNGRRRNDHPASPAIAAPMPRRCSPSRIRSRT